MKISVEPRALVRPVRVDIQLVGDAEITERLLKNEGWWVLEQTWGSSGREQQHPLDLAPGGLISNADGRVKN